MRAVPREGVSAGFLYLALRSPYVQMQLKSKASGSVIDALEPNSIGDIIIPSTGKAEQERMGNRVEAAWEDIAEYTRTMSNAISLMDSALSDHVARAG
jgi:restriction endonuclease S subunit